ncbi:MAG: calcium-translocating P-type ATPase, PMCA-type [Bacteroidales bacterium]|nr:calcium-translocating P-type ATPase, PMCA-type [Bacteroidales bacterium]
MTAHTQHIGLTDSEVEQSRAAHGNNKLTPPAKESLLKKFLSKFSDPLIIILLVAGTLSTGIAFYEHFSLNEGMTAFFEPVGIFIAIFLATGLAFIFELKADKEFSILNKVNDSEPVKVIRGGNTIEVTKNDIVVGDIVIIATGDEVPADGELLESVDMNIDESSLTGEPICHKSANEAEFDKEATYPTNHVLRGTKVMEGHGIFRVLRVGDKTEYGKVYVETQIDNSVKTPLNLQLDGLGKVITKVSYGIAALIVVGRMIMYFTSTAATFDWTHIMAYVLQSLMIAVTLIVVAVPEGLPMAVTLSLAYSMRRMLKSNNLVRKMHACETMGATTVICTDKTGTLTQNQMRVAATNFYDESLINIIYEGIALNTTASLKHSADAPRVLGNPTEGALLLWLHANGIDYKALQTAATRIAEIPFSTERKYMATAVASATGKRLLFVKGAPEIVINLCTDVCGNATKNDASEQLAKYQQQGMRTLAFAYQELAEGELGIEGNKLTAEHLKLLGIVAISDPVRSDVPDAIRECLDAGINIKIVTGDTPATAKEIARQIGLWSDTDSDENIIAGSDFSALPTDELRRRISSIKIISRARPMDKKLLVETLQAENQIVAVTGDGTNDAPALRAAHVGLSMGDGTAVAKDASDITIVDNSFTSICRAVMWGRSLYINIQRFILFQMTVNVVACLIVLAGAFMGTESPLTVTQMLWVNLIMDTFAALALASLPPSEAVMKDKPRDRKDFIINKQMTRSILGVGGLFFAALLVLLYIMQHADISSAGDLLNFTPTAEKHISPYELSLFFTIFVMLQFWNMFNARAFATGKSAFNLRGCSGFGFIAAAILIGQIAIISFGGRFFGVVPLSAADWCIIIAATSIVLWIGEILRALRK